MTDDLPLLPRIEFEPDPTIWGKPEIDYALVCVPIDTHGQLLSALRHALILDRGQSRRLAELVGSMEAVESSISGPERADAIAELRRFGTVRE